MLELSIAAVIAVREAVSEEEIRPIIEGANSKGKAAAIEPALNPWTNAKGAVRTIGALPRTNWWASRKRPMSTLATKPAAKTKKRAKFGKKCLF